jgi:cysteinyl-tRNA synthetase
MTRSVEDFRPREDATVKMYTCGPSIYQLPHIGNYRTFLFEDVLSRYLEYSGFSIKRTLFVTDVEDKAIAEAERENTTLEALTDKNAEIFLQEFENLRGKKPTYIAKSSTSVNGAVQIIESLLKKDYAYRYDGSVYFDPLKFKNFGRLYRLDMSKWPKERRRFHRDTYPGNRWNRGDFILWHAYKPTDREAFWNTSLGKGRPSWNVQDSAMVIKTLGPNADIWCGGVDNIIRHHDYSIAIVKALTDQEPARFWLHAEHLLVDGKKMSKSRGNIIYPKDLIERGCVWPHIRFFLINGHYRRKLNFTFEKFKKACDRLHEFKDMVAGLERAAKTSRKSSPRASQLINKLEPDFKNSMNDDLQVKSAFDALFITTSRLAALANNGKVSKEDADRTIKTLKRIDEVLQVIF